MVPATVASGDGASGDGASGASATAPSEASITLASAPRALGSMPLDVSSAASAHVALTHAWPEGQSPATAHPSRHFASMPHVSCPEQSLF
jgi:hypothetical protein